MTDNDIIKALECCCKNNNCEGCPLDFLTFSSQCASELAIKSLDLINRQQAENKAFAEIIKKQDDEISGLRRDLLSRKNLEESFSKSVKQFEKKLARTVELAKAKAYKEFAERCKDVFIKEDTFTRGLIDNLVKEMVGEDK